MPMPIDEKKRGAIIRIVQKKLSNGNSYDELKRYNSEEALRHDDEKEEQHGMVAAAEAIIRAFETRNAKDLMIALKDFIDMK